jgi:hypothetical protein
MGCEDMVRKGQNKWYPKNPVFIRQGVLTIFKRNYGIILDVHDIDSSISIGENITILLEKYVYFTYRK